MTVFGERRVAPSTRPAALRSSLNLHRVQGALEEAARAEAERRAGRQLLSGAQAWGLASAASRAASPGKEAQATSRRRSRRYSLGPTLKLVELAAGSAASSPRAPRGTHGASDTSGAGGGLGSNVALAWLYSGRGGAHSPTAASPRTSPRRERPASAAPQLGARTLAAASDATAANSTATPRRHRQRRTYLNRLLDESERRRHEAEPAAGRQASFRAAAGATTKDSLHDIAVAGHVPRALALQRLERLYAQVGDAAEYVDADAKADADVVPPSPRFARTRSGHVVVPSPGRRPWRAAGRLQLDVSLAEERRGTKGSGSGRQQARTGAHAVPASAPASRAATPRTMAVGEGDEGEGRDPEVLEALLWEAACERASGAGEGAARRARNPVLRGGGSSTADRRRTVIVAAACSCLPSEEERSWQPGVRAREDAYAVVLPGQPRAVRVMRDQEAAQELADSLGAEVRRTRGPPAVAAKRSQVELGATGFGSGATALDGAWLPTEDEVGRASGVLGASGELPPPSLRAEQLCAACAALGVPVTPREARALMAGMVGSERGSVTVVGLADALAGKGSDSEARQAVIYGPLPPGGPGAEAAAHARVVYPFCRTAVRSPCGWTTEMAAASANPPPVRLRLARVLGFGGGAECGALQLPSPMAFTATRSEVAYFTAGTGVLANVESGTQRLFSGHSAEITAMAHSGAMGVFATAQSAPPAGAVGAGNPGGPLVLVWQTSDVDPSLEVGRRPEGPFRVRARLAHPLRARGIAAIAFSPSGRRLVTVGSDAYASVFVWAWAAAGAKIFEGRCATGTPPAVRGVAWNPAVPDTGMLAHGEFITFGPRHVRRWSVSGQQAAAPAALGLARPRSALSRRLADAQAALEEAKAKGAASMAMAGGAGTRYDSAPLSFGDAPLQDVRCVAFVGNGASTRLVTGGFEGALYVWEGRSVAYSLAAHAGRRGGVRALATCRGGERMLSAGGDGDVHVWAAAKGAVHHVRTIQAAGAGGALLGLAVQPATGTISWGNARGEVYACCDASLADAAMEAGGKAAAESESASRLSVEVPPGQLMPPGTSDGDGPASLLGYHPSLVSPGLASEGATVAWCPASPSVCAIGSVRSSKGKGSGHQLLLFDAATGTALRACRLPSSVLSVAWTPAGDRLACGLAAGGIVVLDPGSAEVVAAYPLATSARRKGKGSRTAVGGVAALQYSPDGERLAAALNHKVLVLDAREHAGDAGAGEAGSEVTPRLRKVATCAGHSAPVVAMDWSADGALLATSCKGSEALFFDAATGARASGAMAAALRRARFPTHTRPLGFEVMGVWPSGAPESWLCSLDVNRRERAVVVGDKDGALRVSTFPCVALDAPADIYRGHCGRIAAVRIACDAKRVASVGHADRAVMLWDVVASAQLVPPGGGREASDQERASGDDVADIDLLEDARGHRVPHTAGAAEMAAIEVGAADTAMTPESDGASVPLSLSAGEGGVTSSAPSQKSVIVPTLL